MIERVAAAGAPRIVHDVWPQIDSGVLTVEVRWREYPLTRRQEGGTRTRAQFAAFGGYPFHMWSDADLVGAGVTIVAGHRPHRVGPVAVVVARDERRVAADAGWVEPVVVVIESAALISSILVHEGSVIVLDAGVDVGDNDAVPTVAERGPDLRRPNPIDAPLDRADLPHVHARKRLQRHRMIRDDPFDLRPPGELVDQRAAAGDLDGVRDPERLEADAATPQQSAEAALAPRRHGRELVVDEFASRVSLRDPMCRREIRLLTQDDPEGRLALLPIGLVENGALDRRGRLRQQRTRVAGNKDGDAYAQCRHDEQPCCSARRTSRGRQNEPPAGIPCSSLLR